MRRSLSNGVRDDVGPYRVVKNGKVTDDISTLEPPPKRRAALSGPGRTLPMDSGGKLERRPGSCLSARRGRPLRDRAAEGGRTLIDVSPGEIWSSRDRGCTSRYSRTDDATGR